MKKNFNISINKLYSIIALCALISSFIIFYYIFYKFKKDFYKMHIQTQIKLVNDFTNFFNEKFKNQIQFMALLKYNQNKKEAKNLKYFKNIFLINFQENKIIKVLKSNYNPKVLKGIDISYLDNLPIIRLDFSKNVFITPLHYSEFLGKKVVSVIIPIKEKKETSLCIVGELDFKNIVSDIFKKFAHRDDIIVITDLDNNFIECSHQNFYIPKINFTEIKFQKRLYTVVGKIFPYLSLRIYYLSPMATSLEILFQNIIFVIFILLLFLFIVYFYVNKKLIIEPLNRIGSQLSDYPKNKIDIYSKIKEINNIKEKFNFARDKIISTIESQKNLLTFLENIFQSSPLPIVIVNNTLKILYSNTIAENIFEKQKLQDILKKEFLNEVNSCIEDKKIQKLYDKKVNGKIFDIIFYPLLFNNRQEIVCIFTDQTEKKVLQEKLIEAQKLETIGLFASGLAHDLNNIVQSILFSVELMKQNLKNEEKLKDYLGKMEKTLDVAVDLLNRLRTYAKIEYTEKNIVDFKDIINNTLTIVKVSMPFFIEIKTYFDENENYKIIGDKFELTQVLMNLILNAKDAIIEAKREKGLIEIKMDKKNSNLVIYVKDNGIGIKEENLDKIYNVFYSTKGYLSKEKGTGLGLSISKKIVEKYNGKIEVSSIYGEGTVFKLTFPLA